MNTMPKYVASTTLQRAEWDGSSVLSGDLDRAVRDLVNEAEGTLLVVGSGSVVRYLLERHLVEKVRLMLFPTVLGRGAQLFADLARPADMAFSDVRQMGATILVTLQLAAARQPQAPTAP